jgi:hypothetical protein
MEAGVATTAADGAGGLEPHFERSPERPQNLHHFRDTGSTRRSGPPGSLGLAGAPEAGVLSSALYFRKNRLKIRKGQMRLEPSIASRVSGPDAPITEP